LNRDVALRDEGGWQVGPHVGAQAYAATGERPPAPLDFSRLLRILKEWRWLIAGAAALGLALAVLTTLLTTPLYKSTVIMEANPPRVEIMDEKSEAVSSGVSSWEFVATQLGLLKSRALAERVAEDLNLANNPEFADQSADPATRVKQAADVIAQNIKVAEQGDGQLIQFDYISASPQLAAQIANAYADAFINSTLQRRYEASAYARKFLERQITKTRADLERTERQLVAYAQSQGIINTSSGKEGEPGGDAASLQGQSLVALNQALAEATARRVAAEGAYRQAVSTGATSDVTASTQALRQSRAALEAEYQQKRTLMKPEHPEMLSLRSQIDELDRQIARETSTAVGSRVNSLLGEYRAALSAENALRSRVAGLKGQVLDLRGRSIQYAILQRDVDTNRALYDALLQRYKEIGVAGGIGAAPVSIVDRAALRRARQARPRLPRGDTAANAQGPVARGSRGSVVGGVGGLYEPCHVAALQHRRGHSEAAAHHQREGGRGQVVERSCAVHDPRPTGQERAPDRRRPAQARVPVDLRQAGPHQPAHRRGAAHGSRHADAVPEPLAAAVRAGAAEPRRSAVDRPFPLGHPRSVREVRPDHRRCAAGPGAGRCALAGLGVQ
jgi:uncharacterized protein involved in exopolysaccharide biosynthesis